MERIVKICPTRDNYDIRESAESSVSVGSLIERLENFPRDSKIVVSFDNGYIFGALSDSNIRMVEVESFEEEREREEREEREWEESLEDED